MPGCDRAKAADYRIKSGETEKGGQGAKVILNIA